MVSRPLSRLLCSLTMMAATSTWAAPASVATAPPQANLPLPTPPASTSSKGSLTIQKPTPRPANGRLAADVLPLHQSIDLVLDPSQESYSGVVDIDVDIATPRTTLWLSAKDLTVSRALVKQGANGQEATFAIVDNDDGVASLSFVKAVSGKATLHLEFTAKFRDDLEGIYRVKAGDDWYAFSQFEALSAREAFPCFDEPGFKIPFDVAVTHKTDVKAIANTKESRSEAVARPAGHTKTTYATTKKLPTYLLAFVVGPVDIVDGGFVAPAFDRKDPLPVRAITVKGKGGLVAQALKNSASIIAAEEKTFGIGYPWDKLDVVAVPDFSAGAMENAGLVTFRDTLLFVDDQSPIGAQKSSFEVIAHEFAHQWFGDLVTMAWWDDLWLNEAFATWFAGRTVQRLRPDFDGDLDLRTSANWVMDEDSLVSARQIRQPITNRGDINGAFDGITYSKGAAVIAMFEEYIDRSKGEGTFNKGVSAYLNAHREGSGTTKEFLAAISTAANLDIAPAFSTFLDQPGVPLVQASCAVNSKTGGPPIVSLSTTRFLPIGSTGDKNKQWDIPVCVSLMDAKKTVVCGLIAGGTGRIELPGKTCPKAWHPNADGGGYYRFSLPPAELKALGAGQKSMTVGERLSFASAIRAGFASATTSFKDALDAALPLASDLEPSVAGAPLRLLGFAEDQVVDSDTARAKVKKKQLALYQPGLNKLGFVERKGELPRDRERRELFFAVVVDAEGPALPIAVAAGKEIFATGTTKKLSNDLWPSALAAAVEHGKIDAATWDAWLKTAKGQSDLRVRSWMLGALASTKDAALSKKALELVFDKELRVNEVARGIFAQASDRRTVEGAFAFVTGRYDEIVARLPEDWRPALAGTFGRYCSDDKAAALDAFFAPKVKTTSGLERELAQTLEGIRLCAAKKKAHQASVDAVFPK